MFVNENYNLANKFNKCPIKMFVKLLCFGNPLAQISYCIQLINPNIYLHELHSHFILNRLDELVNILLSIVIKHYQK